MRIAQEEIFGPVVVVIPFETEAEAVQLARAEPEPQAAQSEERLRAMLSQMQQAFRLQDEWARA